MIKPIDDTVLIQVKKIDEKTASGIVIPEALVERKQMEEITGTVVAVGDLAFYDLIANGKSYPIVGDKVFFKRHSGILHYDEKDKTKVYRIINDQDIYATEVEEKIDNG